MHAKRFCYMSAILCLAAALTSGQAQGQAFNPPSGGWSYIYHGDSAANDPVMALDGTWSHDNGSDEWDGTSIGAGNPGGAGIFSEGDVQFLRFQDTGDPRDYGAADPGSNRKQYFTHDIVQELPSLSSTFLDDGVTISFRARIATTPPLDDLHPDGGAGISPWSANGSVVTDGGKSGYGVRQASSDALISFALATPNDLQEVGVPSGDVGTGGLVMNNLVDNGNAVAGGEVNTGDAAGMLNLHPLADPTAWHEFWITIQAGGAGTHQVNIWVDGQAAPTSFDVTAGNGNDEDTDYIAWGNSATPRESAVDLDFLAFRNAVFAPLTGKPGDTNGDDLVDLVDLANIRNHFFEPGGLAEGDVNFNGFVDFADYAFWRDSPDNMVGSAALFPIPEPAVVMLLCISLISLSMVRRRSIL